MQLEEVDKAISDFLPRFECTLNTIPGVNDITVAKLLSEIGDIRRFPNADKLANFAGVAPVRFSSAGKGDDKPFKQGNRRLQGTIYFLAIQMIQISSKGMPRNPSFYAYYQKQLARGKSKPQALILISRRLVNHLLYVEKQDRVSDAGDTGKSGRRKSDRTDNVELCRKTEKR